MSAIYVLWLRELKRYSRSRIQILTSLGQPMLYLLVLGYGLGPIFEQANQGRYIQFIAPGVIAMAVLFSSLFSGIGLLWDRQFGFLKATLVAPVSRTQIMLGRTCGSATVALIQGLIVACACLVAGFRPASWIGALAAIPFLALIAFGFAALGSVIGATLKDRQGLQMVMNFLVLPLFFLSGALFPLTNLPSALALLTALDPLAYGVDALRVVLSDRTHFGLYIDGAVLVLFGIVLTVVGAWRFERIEA